ncbi:MAG: DUF2334 domain-containing protein [Acidobacteria bacterium]|nr:DUF2334 domain-containing protein [Acidobacteriota bacterium]
MSKQRFDRFIDIVKRHRIRPILAVVPDNRDQELVVDFPDPDFWPRMRALEAYGATIALHGFQHTCNSSGRSLLSLHSRTEFAGVPENIQRKWIRAGLDILRGHGLSPRLFVAPRHGFDSATLHALKQEGLPFLSDGFSNRPFQREGVIWIPQQLWEPVERPEGLWTICLHTNTSASFLENRLDLFLHERADQFTSFEEVISTESANQLTWRERLREIATLQRIRLRSALAL